ncbi:hypothetical protein BDM02DRAFT_3113047 [Thelephora ganbajun]|uniref:Uncharacterized protein n=1 Tax=Thelephora ganbajun TaxID=370292 RepID=A0ACB6ZKA0_THEGA|nr:hypothetical protein BDM02DRAFT_3113047 [Thelephora ganbajun]
MAPRSTTNKAKAAGIGASSFLDLKSELAAKEKEIAGNKAAGEKFTSGGPKPGKKPTIWSKPNKGVTTRAARDLELEAIERPTIETSYAILGRKSRIYEKLDKGKDAGLSEKQYGSLLVDFDRKSVDGESSEEEDVDESLTVPTRPTEADEDDRLIDFIDELGRSKPTRRSKVPKLLGGEKVIFFYDDDGKLAAGPESQIPQHLVPEDPDDPDVIYNPINHFPIYEPDATRVAEIEKEFAEENNPLNIHYDASKEVRSKGAGFYQFSADEETRRQQMEGLKSAREETGKTRAEFGAIDLKPGEVEGMQTGSGAGGVSKSVALEKRKRDLEERRKLVDAKRRKKVGSPVIAEPPSDSPLGSTESQDTIQSAERSSKSESVAAVASNPADDFLAQLERDIMSDRAR